MGKLRIVNGDGVRADGPNGNQVESNRAIQQGAELPAEILLLLAAIPAPHQAKKRHTVLRVAFARANQEPLAAVFDDPLACDARVWWQKWQHVPEIRAAHDAIYAHALARLDAETTAIEAHYRRARLRAVARHASDAPAALAAVMNGTEQKGSDRINAAVTLIKLAEPETDATVGTVASLSVEQMAVVASLTNDELLRVAMGEDLETIRARGRTSTVSGNPGVTIAGGAAWGDAGIGAGAGGGAVDAAPAGRDAAGDGSDGGAS